MDYHSFTARSPLDLRLTISAFTALRTKVILEMLLQSSKSPVLFPDSNLSFSNERIIETNHAFWSYAITCAFREFNYSVIGPKELLHAAQHAAKRWITHHKTHNQCINELAACNDRMLVSFAKDARSIAMLTVDIIPYFGDLLTAGEETRDIAGISSTCKMFEKCHLYFWYVLHKGILPDDVFIQIIQLSCTDAVTGIVDCILKTNPIGEAERRELSRITSDVITQIYNDFQPQQT